MGENFSSPQLNLSNDSQDGSTHSDEVYSDNFNFSHQQINELLKTRETQLKTKSEIKEEKEFRKTRLEEKITLKRMGHKQFLNRVDGFLNILNTMAEAEKAYGKAQLSFDLKSGIFNQEDSTLLKQDQSTFNFCETSSLNQNELDLLKGRLGEKFLHVKILYLPEWKTLKQTLNHMGHLHNNISKFMHQVILFTISDLLFRFLYPALLL